MAVKSYPMQGSARSAPAGAGCAAVVGILMLLVSVGPLFFLLNGGFSIVGMAWLADQIGPYGRMFWSIATFWTVNISIAEKAGLPLAQPVLPWMMVIGSELIELSIIWHRLKKANPGLWVNGGGGIVSVFDYATTAAGLAFAPFAAKLGALWPVWALLSIIIAAPITFGFAGLLARALKGR